MNGVCIDGVGTPEAQGREAGPDSSADELSPERISWTLHF